MIAHEVADLIPYADNPVRRVSEGGEGRAEKLRVQCAAVQCHPQQRQAGAQHPPRKFVDKARCRRESARLVDKPSGNGRNRLVAAAALLATPPPRSGSDCAPRQAKRSRRSLCSFHADPRGLCHRPQSIDGPAERRHDAQELTTRKAAPLPDAHQLSHVLTVENAADRRYGIEPRGGRSPCKTKI